MCGKTEVTVGLSISLTGRFRLQGQQALQGIRLWQWYINAQGGIALRNGERRSVRLICYDDRSQISCARETELEKSYPSQTVLKVYWLPTIKAAAELNANNSAQALVFLEAAAPYELGEPPQLQLGTLYPTYIRGQAQLMAHNGIAAAPESFGILVPNGLDVSLHISFMHSLGTMITFSEYCTRASMKCGPYTHVLGME